MVNIEEFELNIDDTIDSIAVPLSLSMTQCCSPQPWFKHYSGCTFLTLSMYKMMFFINLEGNQFNRSAHSYQMWPIEEITTMLVARLSCRPMGGLDTLSQLAGRGYNTTPTRPCPATLKMRPKSSQAFPWIGQFLPIWATIPFQLAHAQPIWATIPRQTKPTGTKIWPGIFFEGGPFTLPIWTTIPRQPAHTKLLWKWDRT